MEEAGRQALVGEFTYGLYRRGLVAVGVLPKDLAGFMEPVVQHLMDLGDDRVGRRLHELRAGVRSRVASPLPHTYLDGSVLGEALLRLARLVGDQQVAVDPATIEEVMARLAELMSGFEPSLTFDFYRYEGDTLITHDDVEPYARVPLTTSVRAFGAMKRDTWVDIELPSEVLPAPDTEDVEEILRLRREHRDILQSRRFILERIFFDAAIDGLAESLLQQTDEVPDDRRRLDAALARNEIHEALDRYEMELEADARVLERTLRRDSDSEHHGSSIRLLLEPEPRGGDDRPGNYRIRRIGFFRAGREDERPSPPALMSLDPVAREQLNVPSADALS